MKHLLLLAMLFSCSSHRSTANEQELVKITADQQLISDGRRLSLVVETDQGMIRDFCLYTYHFNGAVERDCYGVPYPGDRIKVVQWRRMEILTIDVIEDGVFEITYLETYLRRRYRSFRLVLLNDAGEWGLFVPQIGSRVRSIHFTANTRMGLPVGIRDVNYGY